MEAEGIPAKARELFERAWAMRRDDYDASVAAHFLARQQATALDTLHWNAVALRHAEAVVDERAGPLFASLYLNLGDAQAKVGQVAAARESARRAAAHLDLLPVGGYREFVDLGIRRLMASINEPSPSSGPSDER